MINKNMYVVTHVYTGCNLVGLQFMGVVRGAVTISRVVSIQENTVFSLLPITEKTQQHCQTKATLSRDISHLIYWIL